MRYFSDLSLPGERYDWSPYLTVPHSSAYFGTPEIRTSNSNPQLYSEKFPRRLKSPRNKNLTNYDASKFGSTKNFRKILDFLLFGRSLLIPADFMTYNLDMSPSQASQNNFQRRLKSPRNKNVFPEPDFYSTPFQNTGQEILLLKNIPELNK